jgi:hypothetical protein
MTNINYKSVIMPNGQITLQQDSRASGSNPNSTDTTENKENITENKTDVVDMRTALTTTALDAAQNFITGRMDLSNGVQNIQQLAMPMINSALGLPATSMGGANDQGRGDPGITQQLFGQLFAGGAKGNDMLQNFAGLAATVTGKSLGDVGKVMESAKTLFTGGQLNLANAAGFIAKALGLNEKAVGLIATAYMLLSNPFTMAGAAALFQQAMSLMSESKENNQQANSQKTLAQRQQESAQQQVQSAQQRMQQTAVMQAQINEAMQKLKANQMLTQEQLQKLVNMNQLMKNQQQTPRVDQKQMPQTAQNGIQPQQQQFQQQQVMQQQQGQPLGAYALSPPSPQLLGGMNTMPQPQPMATFQQPMALTMTVPSMPSPPAISFSPPPFSGKF